MYFKVKSTTQNKFPRHYRQLNDKIKMNLSFLIDKTKDSQSARNFLRIHKILAENAPICTVSGCTKNMTEVKMGRKGKTVWRCSEHKKSKKTIRANSFLDNHHISEEQFITIVFLWSNEISVKAATTITEISERTIIQWYQYLRDVCSHYLFTNPIKIGGEGRVVQVDESQITKRKNNKGRIVPECWEFGGIEPETGMGFLEFVPSRGQNVLLPVIKKFVEPGSLIISDEWLAYKNIPQIEGCFYAHETVNHSENFVDPVSGAHTQTVENMWRNCENKFKKMLGVQSTTVESHIDEFMWRQRRGKTALDAFHNILDDIADWYVV